MPAGEGFFVGAGGGGGGNGPGVLIASKTLTAPGQFAISNIPQTYNDLLLITYLQSSAAQSTDSLDITFNNDGGSNYNVTHTVSTATATAPFTKTTWDALIANNAIPCPTLGANFYGWTSVYIPGYTTGTFKTCKFEEIVAFGVSSGQVNDQQGTGFWNSTAAITSMQLFAGVTPFTFTTGSSMRLYAIL